jgi:sodium-coupled neutral amino acid transporter 11
MARLGRSLLLLLALLVAAVASAKRGVPKPTAVLPPKKKVVVQHGITSTESDNKASIPASVFNLINNVAGAGILTLSAGMAGGTGWIPAISICAILGAISAHTFYIIGAACELTGEENFKGLWSRTIGTHSTYMVDSIVACMCLACAVIYLGILGDVFTPLLESANLPNAGRTGNILIVTTAFLLPMSLIRNLSALAKTSILGFGAILYTVIFIVIRAFDGTYSLDYGDGRPGRFVDSAIIATPAFFKESFWNFDFTSLILASNLGLAYISHYNGPAYYRELRDANTCRFGKMVGISFTILTLLYIVTMGAGYETFGDATQGNILLNYHPKDKLAMMGRLATGFSILFGFPLVAKGAREGIASAASSLGYPAIANDKNHVLLVSTMLALVTFISCTVQDVSLVVGLTGAVMGSFIVYICPSIIYTRAVGLVKGTDSKDYERAKVNLALVPFGMVIAGLGVYMTLKEAA